MATSKEFHSPVYKDEIPTPALLLDLDLFERNLNKMADFLNQKHIDFRTRFFHGRRELLNPDGTIGQRRKPGLRISLR